MKINIGILGSSSFIGQELVNQLIGNNYKIYLFLEKSIKKFK